MKKRVLALILFVTLAFSSPVFATDYASTVTIKQVQQALNEAGYNCGTPDGVAGQATKQSIAAYRKDNLLSDSSEIDSELCQALGLEEVETNLDFIDESDGSLLKGLTVTAAEVKEIYDEFEEAWASLDYPEDPDEAEKYENDTTERIAKEHNFTAKQVNNIYFYVISYGVPSVPKDINLKYGELLDINFNGSEAIIKAKIEPSFSNKATIDQNYYNVCDVIKNQGGDKYEKISYWAVADMTDGSEGNVISFDVSKDLIEIVANSNFPDNTLGNYVDDLWILPSLLN